MTNKEEKRITARIRHGYEIEELAKFYSNKLQVKMSLNETINYIIEKSYERMMGMRKRAK